MKNIQIKQDKNNNVLEKAKDIKVSDKKKREETSKLLKEKYEKIDKFKEDRIIKNEIQARIKERLNNNRREYELEFKQIYHNKKVDDKIVDKIKNKFKNNKINEILKQLKIIEEEEKQEKERKKAKLRQKQKQKEENMYGRNSQSRGKSVVENRKFRGTLNQTFSDSKKYKKFDDKEFFKTNNFIDNSHYYNSAQGFYHSNQMNNTNNQFNNNMFTNVNNNMNNNENNNVNDYNELEPKEILIREILNEYRIKINKEMYE